MLTHNYKPRTLSNAMPIPEGVLEPHEYFAEWRRFNINFPAVNTADSEESYHLEIAAPGLNREIFCIEVRDHQLIITTKELSTEKEVTKNYFRKQFKLKPFRRTFSLPDNVQVDAIEANYEDGVLYINIPKIKGKKEKKSLVKVS